MPQTVRIAFAVFFIASPLSHAPPGALRLQLRHVAEQAARLRQQLGGTALFLCQENPALGAGGSEALIAVQLDKKTPFGVD